MNDLERWINLQGPEPDDVRAILDIACGVDGLTPEREEQMNRRLFAAIAADRQRWARRRTAWRVLGGLALAACFGAAFGLAAYGALASGLDLGFARAALPDVARAIPNHLVGARSIVAPAPTSSAAPPERARSPDPRPRRAPSP